MKKETTDINQKITKKDIETENKELKQAIDLLRKNNSLKFTFLKGFIYGFATIVGGTIFLTVLIWILTTLQIIPYFGEIAALFLKFLQK
jgi:hypothetical protein